MGWRRMRYRSFPTNKAGHAAVAKSIARSIRYSVKLDTDDDGNGNRSLRYFPTFRPATDEQRMIVAKAKFRCADDTKSVD